MFYLNYNDKCILCLARLTVIKHIFIKLLLACPPGRLQHNHRQIKISPSLINIHLHTMTTMERVQYRLSGRGSSAYNFLFCCNCRKMNKWRKVWHSSLIHRVLVSSGTDPMKPDWCQTFCRTTRIICHLIINFEWHSAGMSKQRGIAEWQLGICNPVITRGTKTSDNQKGKIYVL